MSADKILVVDDDPALLELVTYNLRAEGFDIITAVNGQEGLRAFHLSQPDLVLLDVSMPKLNGFEVCQRIREMADTPVIILTALGREEDVVRGLELGADEYVTKPFQVKALIARVRAVLRRARTAPQAAEDRASYRDNFLHIDFARRRVTRDGVPVKLTPTEFKLLALLVRHKGQLIEFRQLLENVWGFEYIDDVDYLRVYVWHLRRKIEPEPKKPVYIINELNTGYRFVPQTIAGALP